MGAMVKGLPAKMINSSPFFYFLGLLVCFPLGLWGQKVLWQNSLPNQGNAKIKAVETLSDGNLLAAGFKESPESADSTNKNKDFWLIRAESIDGEIDWERTYGGSGIDVCQSVQMTKNGLIMAGQTTSGEGEVTNNSGLSDIWVVKLNETGEIQWERNYGSPENEGAHSVFPTRDGGYIVAGWSFLGKQDVSGNYGKSDGWLLKLDSSGHIEWESNYGGPQADVVKSVIQTKDGGYVFAGHTHSDSLDAKNLKGKSDGWVVKLDSTGSVSWTKTLGGSQTDQLNVIKETKDNQLITAGFTTSGNHNSSGWAVKLDQKGKVLWEKAYSPNRESSFQSLTLNSGNGFVLGGKGIPKSFDKALREQISHGWVTEVNNKGKIVWERYFKNSMSNGVSNIAFLSEKNFIVAGNAVSSGLKKHSSYRKNDGWLFRVGFCNKTIRSTDSVTACNAFTVPSGDETYNKTGTYKDTIPVKARENWYCDSIITYHLTIEKVNDSMIQKGDTLMAEMEDAEYQWGRCKKGFEPVSGANERMYVPDCNGYYAVKVSGKCTDISRCYQVGHPPGTEKPLKAKEYSVYPLPVQETLFVTFNSPLKNATLRLKDITGKVLAEKFKENGARFRFQTDFLHEGPHYLEIKEGDQKIRKRVMKK